MSSNLELAIAQLKAGNVEGLETVYLEYREPLYQFIFRYTLDEQLSKDLVQDTFEKFQRYAAHFDEEKASLKTYLFKIAYQLMVNKLNRRAKLRRLLPFLIPKEESGPSHDEKLTLRSAIQQLPKQQRAVILLTYYHDLDQKSIADILQIPIGTVKSRLHTAIGNLKKVLMEVEVDEG